MFCCHPRRPWEQLYVCTGFEIAYISIFSWHSIEYLYDTCPSLGMVCPAQHYINLHSKSQVLQSVSHTSTFCCEWKCDTRVPSAVTWCTRCHYAIQSQNLQAIDEDWKKNWKRFSHNYRFNGMRMHIRCRRAAVGTRTRSLAFRTAHASLIRPSSFLSVALAVIQRLQRHLGTTL